jgi:NitT/TauT family transport system ATP-binding protein
MSVRSLPTNPTGPTNLAGPTGATTAIIEVDRLSRSFASADGTTLPVLDDVTLTLHEGEVVALLGKSGSGKSTLLRAIAGLIAPTSGEVRYRGTVLNGANPGVAMVFQSFALMPWLTVQDNVELGLLARGVGESERRAAALRAIDVIGLDGFETAYPKELSGGMRQRVGFARALVLQPDALLMDEPFSALDVLTAENLRNELMDLWAHPDFPTRCLCIVTHNIEEAVLLADRVLVLGANPGHLKAEIAVHLPRPRDRRSPTFEDLVDQIYGILTGRDEQSAAAKAPAPGPLTHRLPNASVGGLAGLVEIVYAHNGQTDLPDLADELSFDVDDLLPLVDAATMLGLLEVEGAQAFLTDAGRDWYTADINASKELFALLAVERAPLVRTIVKALENSNDGTLRDDFFRDLLRRGYSAEDTEKQLDIAIDWGRYGELFDYDADTGELILAEVAFALDRDHPGTGPAVDGESPGPGPSELTRG